jgi:hypothetical protein
MADRYRTLGVRLAVLIFATCVAGQPSLAAAKNCDAEISAALQGQQEVDEGVRLEFVVELTSKEDCASATYDLILVELLPNGQWKSVRKTRRIELKAGTASDLVEHVMASDLKLLEHEARVVECARCKSPDGS